MVINLLLLLLAMYTRIKTEGDIGTATLNIHAIQAFTLPPIDSTQVGALEFS